MEKSKQSIIPVKLQDNQHQRRTAGNLLLRKVVPHLENSQLELLIYEGRRMCAVFLH